ncbi:branched-chain amino acid ABC transporter permease [Actinocatenispora rupis]|uniref:Branched-chain amino acid ABC transporter permease n=1 Tax=Actinocatenispora rupis TaxID=519421 RepID=A0A8J3JBH9_9ACTN|nr:branched-chain amino acid ABC transporter permease [Actinocatenispora rupis]GID11748.1 branched-chain amino acid ABC transporter permease [Actinocatenispora rupis]
MAVLGRHRRLVTLVLSYGVFVGGLLLVPFLFTRVHPYTMADGVLMVLLAVAALGLVPFTGYAGQVSLGQAAFYGTGAYATAILTVKLHLSPWLSLVIGAAVAGLLAYLLGLALFRAAGHYLTLATIAVGLILGVVVKQLDVTGGAEGLAGVTPLTVFGADIGGDVNFFYLAAGILLVATVVVHLVCRSMFARTLLAISDSPVAAQSCGVDPAPVKRSMFVLAAVLAAVAGSLYASWSGFVDASTLDLNVSLQLLIIATVGGRRSVFGAAVGSFVVVSLVRFAKEWLPDVSSHAGGQVEIIAYGLALILVLRLLPRGIVGGAAAGLRRLAGTVTRTPTR